MKGMKACSKGMRNHVCFKRKEMCQMQENLFLLLTAICFLTFIYLFFLLFVSIKSFRVVAYLCFTRSYNQL